MNWRRIYTIAVATIIGVVIISNLIVSPVNEESIVDETIVEITMEETTVEEETTINETTEETTVEEEITLKKWSGTKLNQIIGTVLGPSGKETYYNLNMSGIIRIMRGKGYNEEEYPYHIREDGVKMLGPYIMCAADLELRPRGTIVETSLGTAIVCDTGDFVFDNPRQLDIAVDW